MKPLIRDSRNNRSLEEFTQRMITVSQLTEKALRDYPELREITAREQLAEKVRALAGRNVPTETVTRAARHWQNTKGMFLPKNPHDKETMMQAYKEVFA